MYSLTYICLAFNRTILECKGWNFRWRIYRASSFNRTILECKGRWGLGYIKQGYTFNRTILECKVVPAILILIPFLVPLIELY